MSGTKGQDLLRRWDKGSRQQRIATLTNFINTHRTSTGAEIERDLGPSAMLFFTRITAWLRLTYMLSYELAIQLSAISLFLQGQRFLTNFMEVGGIQMLLDIICHRIKAPVDKQNALLILIHIANSGRVYREMVCDEVGYPEDRVQWAEAVLNIKRDGPELRKGADALRSMINQRLQRQLEQTAADDVAAAQRAEALERDVQKALDIVTGCLPYTGVDMLVEALMQEEDAQTLELFGSIFMALGHGNPRKRSLIDVGLLRVLRNGCERAALCAASALRSLQLSKQFTQGGQSFGLLINGGGSGSNRGEASTPKDESGGAGGSAGAVVAAYDQGAAEAPPEIGGEHASADEVINTLMMLLDRDNVKLRFEGTELLVTAAQNERLLPPVLKRMVDALEAEPPNAQVAEEAVAANRMKASAARALGKILQWRVEKSVSVHVVVEFFVTNRLLVLLLRAVAQCGNKDIDLQRECIGTVQTVLRHPDLFPAEREVMLSLFGKQTVDTLEVSESFSVDELRSLKMLVMQNARDYV